MSQRDKKQENHGGDLRELRSLLGDADGGGFTLEDILAEYRVPSPASEEAEGELAFYSQSAAPKKTPPPAGEEAAKVVLFPGPPPPVSPPEEPAPPLGSEPEAESVPEDAPEKILSFPEEEGALQSLLRELGRRADDYADRMFEASEQDTPEERRRLERLIPGTDREESAPDPLYERPRRRVQPPPEDTPPDVLAREYGRGLGFLRLRKLVVLFCALPPLALSLFPAWCREVLPLTLTTDYSAQAWACVACLAFGMLLGGDLLLTGLGRALRLRLGMDTLTVLAGIAVLADGSLLALGLAEREGNLPYCGVALLGLFFQMHGAWHKRLGLRLACRTAAAAREPYRITRDPGKWNARDLYTKHPGPPAGFGSQIQMDDGAQEVYRMACPVLLLGCLLFSLMAWWEHRTAAQFLWSLCATLTASSAFGGALAFARPFHKLCRRLAQSGGAPAGWPGAANAGRACGVLITDADLFPHGYVELSGIKIFGDFPAARVISYTATLIRDSGNGLGRLFHNLLRSQGAVFRRAEGLTWYEGGLSARIRGDQVLVGSADFLCLMEVPLPPGLNVKQAVFCAIDGELAGVFALSYVLPDTVPSALDALLRERMGPVLATRDFSLIPSVLRQRFRLPTDRMDFPTVQRRKELSDPGQSRGETLTALLCREGLFPLAEAVVGCRRLRRCVRTGAWCCCLGSALGVMLAAYLTAMGACAAISPRNLLLFLLAWLAPVWFLTDWSHRY